MKEIIFRCIKYAVTGRVFDAPFMFSPASGHTKPTCLYFHLPQFQELCFILNRLWPLKKETKEVIIAAVPENVAKDLKPPVIVTAFVLSHEGSLLTEWARTQALLIRGVLCSCIANSSSYEN